MCIKICETIFWRGEKILLAILLIAFFRDTAIHLHKASTLHTLRSVPLRASRLFSSLCETLQVCAGSNILEIIPHNVATNEYLSLNGISAFSPSFFCIHR